MSAVQTIAEPTIRRAVYRVWNGRDQRSRYVADDVFPEYGVNLRSGNIRRIPAEAETKDIDDARASTGGYTRSDFEYDDFPFRTVERGHEVVIDAAADAENFSFDGRVVAADMVLTKLHREHEKRAATLAQDETTYLTGAVTSGVWSVKAVADPIADIKTAIQAIYEAAGVNPNLVVLPRLAWDAIIETDAILDRLGTGGTSADARVANLATVAQLLDIRQVRVADGLKDNAKEGQAADHVDIWDKTKVFVGFVDPNPTRTSVTSGWNTHWTGDGSQYAFRIERYFDIITRRWYIRGRRHVKLQAPTTNAGFVLTGVLA